MNRTTPAMAAYARAYRENLKARRRCVQCRVKLPKGWKHIRCEEDMEYQRQWGRAKYGGTAAPRAKKRREQLLAVRCCINCAAPMPTEDQHQECGQCRTNRRAQYEQRHATRLKSGDCAQCGGENESEYKCCPKCRKAARERWERNRPTWMAKRGPQRSTKWKELEFAEPCKRCGARGEHICLTATAFATARRAS